MNHLNSRELAARWAVTPGYLAKLRCAGRGPAYLKFGTRVAYRVVDVEEYESKCMVKPLGS